MRTIAAARSRPIGLGDRAGRDEQRPVPVAFPRHGGRQRGATHPSSSGRGGGISEIIKGGCAEYTVVSTKNCTIAARRIPPPSLRRARLATERFSLLHRLREHLPMPAEHPFTPRSCRCLLGFSLISRPLREKTLNSLAMPPHQPLRVQHAGTILLLVPRWPEPPINLKGDSHEWHSD